jgi:alpha-ribazole phosphatase
VPATKLILVRHGRTDWSDQKRYCGYSDIPLNERGRGQVQELGAKLREHSVHKIYSSPMERAVQSANMVFAGQPVELIEDLREMSFGLWDGLTYHEIMARDPQVYSQWLENPLRVTPPEGENLSALARRVRRGLTQVLKGNHGKTVALFTHGGPIKIILCDILEQGLENIWKVHYDWAEACVIDFDEGKGTLCSEGRSV